MSRPPQAPARRRGTALLWVLVAATLLSSVLLACASATIPLRREVARTRTSDQAATLAQAGLLLGRRLLAADPGFSGLAGVPLGEGQLDVVVVRTGPAAVTLLAAGTVDGVRRRLEATLVLDAERWLVTSTRER